MKQNSLFLQSEVLFSSKPRNIMKCKINEDNSGRAVYVCFGSSYNIDKFIEYLMDDIKDFNNLIGHSFIDMYDVSKPMHALLWAPDDIISDDKLITSIVEEIKSKWIHTLFTIAEFDFNNLIKYVKVSNKYTHEIKYDDERKKYYVMITENDSINYIEYGQQSYISPLRYEYCEDVSSAINKYVKEMITE